MKKTFKSFFSFFVIIIVSIVIIYISFFTNIPTKVGNTVNLKVEEISNDYEYYDANYQINDLGITMNTYYYEKLNDNQKKIYSSIANAVKNFQSEFAVRDYVASGKDDFANEVSLSIEAFINDHPEVFYLKSQYSTYVLSGIDGNIGYIKLNYTENSIEEVNKKLDIMRNKVNEYVDEFKDLDKFEKELKIHDKLAYSVSYCDLNDIPRQYHTAEGTLIEGIGICDGFSKALQIIYNKVGIDSIIVLGTLDGNPHAWNMVKLDDEWYHLDITASRSIYDDTGIINHAYFNLNDENIKKSCVMDKPELLPPASSQKYNYCVYNDYWIDEDENISSQLNRIYKSHEDSNYIEFYYNGDVSKSISSILISLRAIDPSFINESKMYYYNIQNTMVIVKN